MRPLLIASLAAAFASVGALAYQVLPAFRPGPSAKVPPPLVTADPRPVRVVPLRDDRGAATIPAAKAPPATGDAANPGPGSVPGGPPSVAAHARGDEPGKPDVLAGVARTLDAMRPADGAAGQPPSGDIALTQAQAEALRQSAARRKVRPVTRTPFRPEAGADVPPAVFLHPVPPELAGPGPADPGLGYAVVGQNLVVVSLATRKVVAVTGL